MRSGLGVMIFILLAISGRIGAFCWPYTINTWLVFFDKPPSIVWWHGFLLGYVPFFWSSINPCCCDHMGSNVVSAIEKCEILV